ncbi:MAG: histidinol-phosphate transaminase [Glaciecola sp.]|jgi:histidinol-phosphate aminotransferase
MSIMTFIANNIAKHVKDLVPYASARRLFAASAQSNDSQVPIWLNANEAPTSTQYELDTSLYNRYPDCQPDAVISAYAQYAGVNKDQVLVSRGADEGIELLIRAFCDPVTDSVLICPPTYGMYAISARTCNVGVKSVPLINNDLGDFQLDVANIIAASNNVKLVFICAPNNPTGTLPSRLDIETIIQHYAQTALVVIDEAYIEFTDEPHLSLLAQYPNVVVLRTLSKAFALAGLRCGFTLAQPDIIHELLKVIAPYPLSAPVADIAAQALSAEGLKRMREQVASILHEQVALVDDLASIGDIELVGAQTGNFILFRTIHKDALMQFLVHHKVFIRDQSKQQQLENCLRISTGNAAENARLLELITQFYQIQEATAL